MKDCIFYFKGTCAKGLPNTPCDINGCVAYLPRNKMKKRKDCKYYVSGKCDLMYRIHGYGKPFNSRKYGWMWRCCDYVLCRPCENYKSRND